MRATWESNSMATWKEIWQAAFMWKDTRRSLCRSEEHTSELQSPCNLVCRLLLEKKNTPHLRRTRARHPAEGIRRALTQRRAAERAALAAQSIRVSDCVRTKQSQFIFFFLMNGRPPKSTLFPYPTLFR